MSVKSKQNKTKNSDVVTNVHVHSFSDLRSEAKGNSEPEGIFTVDLRHNTALIQASTAEHRGADAV